MLGDPEEKPLQMQIFKTPEKGDCVLSFADFCDIKKLLLYFWAGKLLSLDEDILSIDGIMQKLDQLDAEK